MLLGVSCRLMKIVSTLAAGSLMTLYSFFVISTLKLEFEVSFNGK